jgi:hypothetical protein
MNRIPPARRTVQETTAGTRRREPYPGAPVNDPQGRGG